MLAARQQANNHPAPPPSVRLSLSPLPAAVLVTTPHPLLPLLPEPPPLLATVSALPAIRLFTPAATQSSQAPDQLTSFF